MLAPSKRRASFYTLPIVIVIGFGTVAGLAAWQRADVIADLADQVAHGDKSEATAAVRKLAAIPRPPLSVLVEAATSDERATAEAAQVEINRMLGQWQRQVDRKQRIGSVSSQVTELAATLAAKRREFSSADFPWLSSAARKIVRIANKCPAKKTPLVALHCDEIMAVVERHHTPVTGHDDETDGAQPRDMVMPASSADQTESQHARLEQDFSTFPTWRMPASPPTDAQAPAPIDSAPTQQPAANGSSDGNRLRSANGEQVNRESNGGDAVWRPAPNSGGPATQPEWAQPMYRVVPPAQAKTATSDPAPPRRITESLKHVPANPRAAAIETRRLLERWRDSKGNETQFVEHDLATRGFKKLPQRLVEQYLSDDADVRVHLVDSVLAEASVDARPWLALLADDEDADVRLTAVTVMATSNDKSLVEKAWQVAIHDRDPRIADLAGRLRERRR